jgi:hypothetical protein
MTPETRAKKDKCTLVVSAAEGKLRILGASDDPLIILKGQVCERRAVGGQVHVVQRDAPLLDRSHQGRGHGEPARSDHRWQSGHQRKAGDGAEAPGLRDLCW